MEEGVEFQGYTFEVGSCAARASMSSCNQRRKTRYYSMVATKGYTLLQRAVGRSGGLDLLSQESCTWQVLRVNAMDGESTVFDGAKEGRFFSLMKS